MFGYVRPLKGELRVRELEEFKAVYCGLCCELGRRYGFLWRNVLSYDLTFLALVLSSVEPGCTYEACRCPANPLRRRSCRSESGALALAADVSILLAYYKLLDDVRDESALRRIGAGIAALAMRRAKKKAERRRPELAEAVRRGLEELSKLEAQKETSLDRTADAFARILRAMADGQSAENTKIMREIFYHTGRWLYILDACDDLAEDHKKGVYNAVAARFAISDGVLAEEARAHLAATLEQSLAAAARAFELLKTRQHGEIIKNIVYLGLPSVTAEVLSGVWRQRRRQHERPV